MNASAAGALQARPHAPTSPPARPGTHPLTPGAARAGLLVVPGGYRAERPAPLVVLLHGAGGDAHGIGALLEPLARALGDALLVVPESRDATWHVIASDLGPDVRGIDVALARVFERYAVDPRRVAIAGFSDGASYALTLGLANGALFDAVLAFSPGFEASPAQRGRPRLFVSHGTGDRVLPIDRTSRRLVPRLQAAGYEVKYEEFDGPHTVPGDVQDDAVRWLGWRSAARPPRSRGAR
ncbi:MAG: alpha/beta hydrolase [Anaeromyxobacteraceae bacterium]